MVDPGWPLQDLWPKQYITLWSRVLPTKFGGHRAFLSPGRNWPRKGVWVCAVVMTPFLQASRPSLAYQFPTNAPLMCPPFSIFIQICIFSLIFGQNFSSQEPKFPNFRSQDPSFFKENQLPISYFWKPAAQTQHKKVECPTGFLRQIDRWMTFDLWSGHFKKLTTRLKDPCPTTQVSARWCWALRNRHTKLL